VFLFYQKPIFINIYEKLNTILLLDYVQGKFQKEYSLAKSYLSNKIDAFILVEK